jgi:hypothetical protein
MTDPRTQQQGRSECPVCPPWVIACAHFGGWAATLVDQTLRIPCMDHAELGTEIFRYTGGLTQGQRRACGYYPSGVPHENAIRTNDYDWALAAFEAASQRLLERD